MVCDEYTVDDMTAAESIIEMLMTINWFNVGLFFSVSVLTGISLVWWRCRKYEN